MAIDETVAKISVNVKLNNGTTASGSVKTVSVNLGNLKTTGFNAQKAMNVIDALTPCLDKAVYEVQKVEVSTLTKAS